jgi:hypothetical protein
MGKRLIGSDGKLVIGTFGPEITTGDLTDGQWYLTIALGATTGLPSGATAGYMFRSEGETISTGDIVKLWTGQDMCDIQSWGLEFQKESVDVTTFCDNVRTKRAGKTDVTGTCEGVFTTEVTSIDGGFLNQFMDIVRQTDTTYTVVLAEGSTMLCQLYADKTANDPGEIEAFYLAPIELTGFSASAGGEDAQSFSAPFVIAPSEDMKFAYYEFTVPAAP